MNHINRFDGKGEIYAKARPKYANEFFDYWIDTLHIPTGSVFADIGSGTGIFTEQLLHCGYRVYAVEPNDDMRRKAAEKLSQNKNFISVNGNDHHMNLPDQSIDFLTAAQAFHWFDPEQFQKECRRVLKPGGKVFILYNSRDETADSVKALSQLRYRYNPDFHGFSNGISNEACIAFFGGNCKIYRAKNDQTYDRQAYLNRVLSSSYSLTEDDQRYPEYLKAIHNIFDAFSVDGFITEPVNTVAYMGEVSSFSQKGNRKRGWELLQNKGCLKSQLFKQPSLFSATPSNENPLFLITAPP